MSLRNAGWRSFVVGLACITLVSCSVGALPALAPNGASIQLAPKDAADAEHAIQAVIQAGNAEQQEAIAKRDSSVMRATSTEGYFQDLEHTNDELLSSGVTGIQLLRLDWGPIEAQGGTATALTYETWSTTYADGSDDQARDRNVYSLELQSDGAWKIRADEHPDDEGTTVDGSDSSAPTAPADPAPPSNQSGPRSPGVTANWSGYVTTDGPFTAVHGAWIIPSVATPNSNRGAGATWVGIGGVHSRDLIQAGTGETLQGGGQVQYMAWFEMLPNLLQRVPLGVHPGDSVSVSLDEQAADSWQISFENRTTGASYERNAEYTSSLASAEWIEEAPSDDRGHVMPLENFGSITFSEAAATKAGSPMSIADARARPMSIANHGREPLASPSVLTDDGTGFTVTRSNVETGSNAGELGRNLFGF